jgi:hypothetical protein
MPQRLRSLIGTILLIVLVIVWALLAMVVAQPISREAVVWQWVYYVVAGFCWVLPAGAIIWWMSRPRRGGAR